MWQGALMDHRSYSTPGRAQVLAKVEEDNVRQILINISLRIRPCFEKDRPAVRSAAVRLFGNLSRFGDGPSKVPFLEQVWHTAPRLLVDTRQQYAVYLSLAANLRAIVHRSTPTW